MASRELDAIHHSIARSPVGCCLNRRWRRCLPLDMICGKRGACDDKDSNASHEMIVNKRRKNALQVTDYFLKKSFDVRATLSLVVNENINFDAMVLS